jgi:Lipase maturation factor
MVRLYEACFPKAFFETVYYRFHCFSLWSSYGLFRTMTTNRTELVVEGSNDLQEWRVYEFRYKPTSLARRPALAFPHLPRLDWMLWFCQFHKPCWLDWLFFEVGCVALFCVPLLQNLSLGLCISLGLS